MFLITCATYPLSFPCYPLPPISMYPSRWKNYYLMELSDTELKKKKKKKKKIDLSLTSLRMDFALRIFIGCAVHMCLI